VSKAAYNVALTLRVVAGSAAPVPWGSAADNRQRADMHALLAEDEHQQHVWQRARGYMKTTDSGVAALAALLTDVPPNGVVQVFAVDLEQARKIMTAIRTAAAHLPSVPLRVTANRAVRTDTDAAIVVETSDAASALGASPHLLILDEFANWKDTASFQGLWDNVYSGLPKQGNARILIVTSAGPIGTWAYERLVTFQKSGHWRYSLAPGPAPWRTPEDLERQREGLSSAAAFRMFHLNEFTTPEDGLVGEEDLAVAVAAGLRARPYDPRHNYVVTADLGVVKDATVVTVCHREGNRVVQDALARWVPRLGRHVRLDDVRAEIARLHSEYAGAPVRIDPSQARQMVQGLQEAGVMIETVTIDAAYNHACATALQQSFEQRRIDLLDVPDQTKELGTVVVRTRTAGGKETVSLDSTGNGHDDIADVLGMAAEFLLSRPYFGQPSVNNHADLVGAEVRRGGGQRQAARLGPRDLGTVPKNASRRRPGALSAYDRIRQRVARAETSTTPPSTNPPPAERTRYFRPDTRITGPG
jgi:hypothetical protein